MRSKPYLILIFLLVFAVVAKGQLYHQNGSAGIQTTTNSNVGINTDSPGQTLDVHGDVEVGGGASSYDGSDEFIHINSKSADWYISVRNLSTESASDFHIGLTQGQDGMFHIQPDGNVGIGTTSPLAKLSVNGDIRATEVHVRSNIAVPDYVFDDDYNLRTLEEVDAFVQEFHHLPEIPSAVIIDSLGMDLSKMNMLLLKKIEELTLYLIAQNKKIEELEKLSGSKK